MNRKPRSPNFGLVCRRFWARRLGIVCGALVVFVRCHSMALGDGADQCPAAILGSLLSAGSEAGTTVGMANDYGQPTGCTSDCSFYGSTTGRDVIYQLTVAQSGAWVFDMCSTSPAWDSSLQIRTGGDCPGSTCVGMDGDSCSPGCGSPYQARMTAVLTAGETYYLIIDSRSPVQAGVGYTLHWAPPSPCGNGVAESGEECDDGNSSNGDGCDANCQWEPPTNDHCATATPIGSGVHPFSLLGSDLDGAVIAPCNAGVSNDVWFAYTAGCTGLTTVSTCGTNEDTVVEAYDGCECSPLAPFSPRACGNDECGTSGVSSSVDFPVAVGGCHLLRVSSWGGGEFTGDVSVSCLTPVCGNNVVEWSEECDEGDAAPGDGCDAQCQWEAPPNDQCADGMIIEGTHLDDLNIAWGGASADQPASCNVGGTTVDFGVWYYFLAPVECTAQVTRVGHGGLTDTVAALFVGTSCGDLMEVACEDVESASFSLAGGTEYRLLIGAWGQPADLPGSRLDVTFDCTIAGCGDGTTSIGEECDDGNTTGGDGCSAFCQLEGACCLSDGTCIPAATLVTCGALDGSFVGAGAVCGVGVCPQCGNGVIESGERCDDGNQVGHDGCSGNCDTEGACCVVDVCALETPSDCTISGGDYAGDETTCPGTCGLGACCVNGVCSLAVPSGCAGVHLGGGTTCTPDPCPSVCGNGELEPDEACDDGNTSAGDGCDANCQSEGIACTTNVECTLPDADVCTCDRCVANLCQSTPTFFGNANCTGPGTANLDDILCVLGGFGSFGACPNGDLAPGCTGNNVINLDDILRVLGAFSGADPCGCVP